MAGIAGLLPARREFLRKKGAECALPKADRRAGAARINEGLIGRKLIETMPPASECFLNFHSRLLKLGFHG
jgi:hypothetical protein